MPKKKLSAESTQTARGKEVDVGSGGGKVITTKQYLDTIAQPNRNGLAGGR